MELNSLAPGLPTLKIGDVEYQLRKITLRDEVWMQEKGIGTKWVEGDALALAQVTFRLLSEQSDFRIFSRKEFDENGAEIEVQMTGPQQILEKISGSDGLLKMYEAVLQVSNLSREKVDTIVEAVKKNIQKSLDGI